MTWFSLTDANSALIYPDMCPVICFVARCELFIILISVVIHCACVYRLSLAANRLRVIKILKNCFEHCNLTPEHVTSFPLGFRAYEATE